MRHPLPYTWHHGWVHRGVWLGRHTSRVLKALCLLAVMLMLVASATWWRAVVARSARGPTSTWG